MDSFWDAWILRYPVSWRNAKCQKYKRRGSPVRQAEGIQKCVRKNIFSFTVLNLYGNIHDRRSNKQTSINPVALPQFSHLLTGQSFCGLRRTRAPLQPPLEEDQPIKRIKLFAHLGFIRCGVHCVSRGLICRLGLLCWGG